jgi:hypothetical protein
LPPNAVLQSDGVWHFVWSNRAVADATLLAASIRSPSISALELPVHKLDQQAETDWLNKKDAAKFVALAKNLGITSFVVQMDIQVPQSQRAMLNRFTSSLLSDGLTDKNLGTELVFRVPGPVRSSIWGRNCQIDNELFFAGFVHVDCVSDHARTARESIISPFELPSPVLGLGLHLDSPKTVDIIGTQIRITSGNSGWIIFLPNLLAAIGGLITLLYLFAIGSQPTLERARSTYRQFHPGHRPATSDSLAEATQEMES